jgi:hypothetical protein
VKIKRVLIANYRSIKRITFNPLDITAFVGPTSVLLVRWILIASVPAAASQKPQQVSLPIVFEENHGQAAS